MTYIEFFDRVASENVSACLTYVPDRVIYIGENSRLMKKHIANYEKVFENRGCSIEFMYRTVSRSNPSDAVRVLTELINEYDDCVFDITGGEEMYILALGIVCERHPEKDIRVHMFNLRNNTAYACSNDGTVSCREVPTLSIDENVRIYGGDVVYGNIDENKTYVWNLDGDFLCDLEAIWEVCRYDVKSWNFQSDIFRFAEMLGEVSEDGLTVTVRRNSLERYLLQNRARISESAEIIDYLSKCGLITYSDDVESGLLCVSYKNAQVKKCIVKAGQALEMKVYTTLLWLADKDGKPIYNDILNGVVIDWDGELHEDGELPVVYDTVNEIDIMLMHDIIPVFISCKNGLVTSDELYKLESVAERFGGPYSKKVLVATALDYLGEQGEYLRQRARDMGIKLIENVQDMDEITLENELRGLWNYS